MKLSSVIAKIIDKNWRHGVNKVSWWLLYSNSSVSSGNFNTSTRSNTKVLNDACGYNCNSVCYSELRGVIQKNRIDHKTRDYYHLVTHINLDYYPKKHLSAKEMRQWLLLSKKHGLLPKYANAKQIVGKGNVLKASFRLNSIPNFTILYIYLTIIRFIKEEPGMVKIMLNLVNKHHINYFVAFVIATYHGVRENGHSILNNAGAYPKPISVKEASYDLKIGLSLKKLVLLPEKYCTKNLTTGTHWDMFSTLNKIKSDPMLIKFSDVDSLEVNNYINSGEKNA